MLIFRRDQSLTLILINQHKAPGLDLGQIFGVLLDNEHYSGLSQKNHFKDLWSFLQGKINALDFFVTAGELRKLYHLYAKNLPEDVQRLL